jgi:hypothetical protein
VGVVVTAAADSIMVRDLLSPVAARQLATALLQGAEQVAPTPAPTEPSKPLAVVQEVSGDEEYP